MMHGKVTLPILRFIFEAMRFRFKDKHFIKKTRKEKKLVSNNVTSTPDAKNCSRFSKPYKNWLAL